jgi:TPR repeat protein
MASTSISSSTIAVSTSSVPDASIVKFLIKYADDGDDGAQYRLGVRYLEGRGVPADKAKGTEYLKKAAAQRNSDATEMLRQLNQQAEPSNTQVN